MNKTLAFCLILSGFYFISCSARIDGTISKEGSSSLVISSSLGSRITGLIRMMEAVGGQASGNILDGELIARSVSNAPGVASASFKNTSPSSIEGNVRVSKIDDFLTGAGVGDAHKGFVTFKQTDSGGSCELNINKQNGNEIIKLLSPEIERYLNALMAPIVTGDEISKKEYLELIEVFYSKPIADEISNSRIKVSLEFPGTITGVTGGTFSGSKAEFDIALVDLLVLESPVRLEVVWR